MPAKPRRPAIGIGHPGTLSTTPVYQRRTQPLRARAARLEQHQ